MDLKNAIENLTVYAPNATDFWLLNQSTDLDDSSAVEAVLQDWASRFKHSLRPPETRNLLARLSATEVAEHIGSRLSRDIVFNTRGFEESESRAMAEVLVSSFELTDGVSTDFVIGDWTFCDLLVCTGQNFTVVIASLGED
jgi:hypothetical protein